jgi:hypothetical protein
VARARTIFERPEGGIRPDGLYQLDRPYAYALGRKSNPLKITVPKGYATDFASIPRLVQWVIPKTGAHDGPAVIHDWLYNTHLVSKPVADAIFLEALLVAGVRPFVARVMFEAVSLFGGRGWTDGPNELKRRSPEWHARIFKEASFAGVNKEELAS